ncbi:molybdenum cofactor cytidylyltransferase [Chitinophaga dinghuensis]|uniref:Molybdenum cofactor cytidylyltransferase n=1 Tax=Chitinophaga dinghuensis TaxID=1539050 RepID=A0A327WER0_9BACT|nr:nucleotidyltransferase family protein [Chitinophaga dinghuensis]RAJ87896.1 molybdenum cofactor cytidylyltransferase [Chitinophaga dinghuensis]
MTGIIILAAGASQRLGQPKQLLQLEQQTLLERVIHTALNSNIGPVIVVLGANAANIQPHIAPLHINIVINEKWAEGMGSSIAAGMQFLLRTYNNVSSTFLLVCDQPFIDSRLLHRMFATPSPIVACTYNKAIGTPVLFQQAFFPALQALQSPEGARKLLQQYKDQVKTVDFPQGGIDIDTIGDYNALLSQ